MVHCGYEPTAIHDTFARPLKALSVFLRGPSTDGLFAPELPVIYTDPAKSYIPLKVSKH
jgi:hypothetical protein